MSFWNFVQNENEDAELRITGEIKMEDDFWSRLFGGESTTPKGFRKELEKHRDKNLTVWINSPGGDVYAASSIYTALKEHKGKVTVKIDGYACSAASVIAMAGDETLMSPTSIMMIHNPWSQMSGEAKDMRHAADILDEVKETILNAYTNKTKKSRDKISNLMDEETYMSAKKAIKESFADGILYQEENGEEENAFAFSRMAIQNSASETLKTFIEQYNKRLEEKKIKTDEGKNNDPEPQATPTASAVVNTYIAKQKTIERKLKNL